MADCRPFWIKVLRSLGSSMVFYPLVKGLIIWRSKSQQTNFPVVCEVFVKYDYDKQFINLLLFRKQVNSRGPCTAGKSSELLIKYPICVCLVLLSVMKQIMNQLLYNCIHFYTALEVVSTTTHSFKWVNITYICLIQNKHLQILVYKCQFHSQYKWLYQIYY